MPENIHVDDRQPAMTTRQKEGEPVTSDQFAFDFTVDIQSEGCYAIDVLLMEDRFFGDEVVLENCSATVQPSWLGSLLLDVLTEPGVEKWNPQPPQVWLVKPSPVIQRSSYRGPLEIRLSTG